jgi:DNA polymerase III subunit delta'
LNPLSFAAIRGQERALQFLQAARGSGRLAHALLFSGPRGVGKFSTALCFAAALNCAADEPCGQCPSCRKILARSHPDLLILRALPDKSEIAIEQVRQVIAALNYPPFEGRCRAVIIDGAEDLNRFSANSLLKTLEEPTPQTILLLVAHQLSRIPPTILSRCQLVRFSPLPDEVVRDELARDSGIAPADLAFAAAFSGGSIPAGSEELQRALLLRGEWAAALAAPAGEREAALSRLAELCQKEEGTFAPLGRVIRLSLRQMLLASAGAPPGDAALLLPGKTAKAERILSLFDRLAELEEAAHFGRASVKLGLEDFFVELNWFLSGGRPAAHG